MVMKYIHYATFNGKHNLEKSKLFLTLYYRQFEQGIKQGLDITGLVELSMTNEHYMVGKIPQWTEYKYLKRGPGVGVKGFPAYCYKLAARGIRFCEVRIPVELREDTGRHKEAARSRL